MKEGKCPHCGRKNCYKHCYESSDGIHVADPSSTSHDGDTPDDVIDINCINCGQSGGIVINLNDVQWN